MSMVCVVALIVLITVIFIGCKTDLNMGLLGVVGAYIIGAFVLGMTNNAIIALWPTSMFFSMVFILSFFQIAILNNTLEQFAKMVIYKVRNYSWAIPIVLFLLIMLIAGLGTGSNVIYIMVVPAWAIANEAKMHPIFTASTIVTGCNAGAWLQSGTDGVIAKGLLESVGWTSQEAAHIANLLSRNYFLVSLTIFVLSYIIFKGWKCQSAKSGEAPSAFTKQQKRTGLLIIIMMAIYIIPTTIANFVDIFPITWLVSRLNLPMLCAVFTLIALLLKLGNCKEVISTINWNITVVICGMGLMIGVVVQTGLVDILSAYLSANFSDGVIPILLGIVGGILSLFTTTIGVVLPTLYPVAHALAESTSLAPGVMISVITVCAGVTGVSPFSFIGAMNYQVCPEEQKKTLFGGLWGIALVSMVVSILYAVSGIYAL